MSTTLTFLVVDQVGSTDQIQRLGDAPAAQIRTVLLDITGSAVASWGGSIYHYTGDGLMASFENASDALSAGATMQRRAEEFTKGSDEGKEIVLRVGVHSGQPVITEEGHFIGIACHIAARLCSVASSGSIVSSSLTRSLADPSGELPLESIGHRTLKGIPEPHELFELSWRTIQLQGVPFEGAVAPAPPPVGGRTQSQAIELAEVPPSPLIDRLMPRIGTFVGRDTEIERLRLAWADASGGQRRTVFIGGDAGLGKSSLAARFGAAEAASDGLVLAGRCDEYASTPFAPFIEALGYLVQHAPVSLLTEHASRYGDILNVIVPQLGTRLGVEFAPSTVDELARERLFAAVADLLKRVAETRPIYLLIDDLHWATEATARMLRHLVRESELRNVLLVATYRPSHLEGDGVGALTRDMWREPGVDRIELSVLTSQEVDDLAVAMLSESTADRLDMSDLAERIRRETGGTPFFVREVLRHLRERDGTMSTLSPGEALPLPDSVVDVIYRRVDHLGDQARPILDLAAVIGAAFDLRVLAAVADTSEDDVADVLDAAEAAQLIVETQSADGEAYRFAHDLIRSALYESFGAARRRRIHNRVAGALNEVLGLTSRSAPDVLRHLAVADRAERLDLAMTAANLAAETAASRLAYEDAVAHQQTALALAKRWDPSNDEVLAEREAALGEALNLAGQVKVAGEHFWTAAELARERGRLDILGVAAIGYGGELPTMPPNDQRAIGLLQEVLAQEKGSTALRSRAAARLAEWRHVETRLDERQAWCAEAESIARTLEDADVLGRVLVSQARALHGPHAAARNLEVGMEIRRIADATGSDVLRFHAASIILTSMFSLSDIEGCAAEADIVRDLGFRLRHVEYARSAIMWDSVQACARGDWFLADKKMVEMSELFSKSQHLHAGLIQSAMLLPRLFMQGEAELIYDACSRLDAHFIQAICTGYAAEAGRTDNALAHFETFGPLSKLAEDGGYHFWHACMSVTVAASWMDDRDIASEMYDIVAPFADQDATMGTVAFLGVGRHHLASLAATLGNLDEADDLFAAAAEQHEEMGMAPWAALSRIERARVLERRGGSSNQQEATDLAATAIEVADEFGLGAVHRRAAAMKTQPVTAAGS